MTYVLIVGLMTLTLKFDSQSVT